MAEVLMGAPYNIETEIQFEEQPRFDEELLFPKLDGILFPIVVANADAVAPCRWMDGAEVSLTVALNNYYRLMTEENADEIIADVYEFLIGKTEENKENELEPEPTAPIPQQENKVNDEDPAATLLSPAKTQIKTVPTVKETAKATLPEVRPTPAAKAEAQPKDERPVVQLSKAEETKDNHDLHPPIAQPPDEHLSGLAAEIAETPAEPEPISLPEAAQEPEADIALVLPATLPIDDGVQPRYEGAPTSEPMIEESEPARTALDSAVQEASIVENIAELELEAGPDPEPLCPEPYEENKLDDRPETLDADPPTEHLPLEANESVLPDDRIDAAIEKIDALLAGLDQSNETDGPGEVEILNELVDTITELSAGLEPGGEIIESDEVLQEQLQELYIALLKHASLAHRTELADVLVSLTLRVQSPEVADTLEEADSDDDSVNYSIAHKSIKGLTAIVNTIVKTWSHVIALGRSALRVHIGNFAEIS